MAIKLEQELEDAIGTACVAAAPTLNIRGFTVDDEDGEDNEELAWPILEVQVAPAQEMDEDDNILFEASVAVGVFTHFPDDRKRTTLATLWSGVRGVLDSAATIDGELPAWAKLLGMTEATPGTPVLDGNRQGYEIEYRAYLAAYDA